MDESHILSEFDRLCVDGQVFYDENQATIEHADAGLNFQFLLTSALLKKPTFQSPQANAPTTESTDDETRPGSDITTAGFEIGKVGSTHILVANKFSFARPHMLLLTCDGYRRQYEPLDEADFTAVMSALNATKQDYVSFYNCGKDGGCSRLHKHMQLMPLPANSFASFLDTDSSEINVPFRWFHQRFENQPPNPQEVLEVYTRLLSQATKAWELSDHIENTIPGAACPHNMILTKRWIIVLPRRKGAINKESGANSLGMLGIIAVATEQEIHNWQQLGLSKALRELGVPK